jgi:hypothetical protein
VRICLATIENTTTGKLDRVMFDADNLSSIHDMVAEMATHSRSKHYYYNSAQVSVGLYEEET